MAGQIILHDVTVTDYAWSFDREHPQFTPHIDGAWVHAHVTVDPFPAYRHDPPSLRAAVADVRGRVDLLWDVHLFSGDREETGRSNGHSTMLNGYVGAEYRRVGGMIWLSGKRIPPHPAMTRHLVAHELGHNVEWMINAARGHDDNLYDDTLIREYTQLRGLPDAAVHHGAGGTWHDSAHEVFACDFRVVVCGVEAEYWPHPGVARPGTLPVLKRWWRDELDRLTDYTAGLVAA